MTSILLLTMLCLILLVNLIHLKLNNLHKNQQIQLIQEKLQKYEIQIISFAVIQEHNHNLMEFYYTLGQSISALHIQLQAAQKVWQMNPSKAEISLLQAYDLSGNIMQEIRQIFKNIDE